MALANASIFDGSVDFLRRTTAFTGAALSKLYTGVVWFKHSSSAETFERIFSGDTGSAEGGALLNMEADDKLRVIGKNTSHSNVLAVTSDTAHTKDVWNVAYWSDDLTDSGKRHFYLNNTAVDASYTTYLDQDMNFNASFNWQLGTNWAESTSLHFTGELSHFWWGPGQYIDFSVEANRRKVVSSTGKLVDMGPKGALLTGSQPIFFLRNAFGTYQEDVTDNANDWTEVGALTEGTGPEIAGGVPIMRRRRAEAA